MPKVKIVGIEKLQKKLIRNMDASAVKTVVQKNGSEMQTKAQQKAPVDTGNLKRSIGLAMRDGGLTAEVEPTAEYAPYVEFGTRFMNAQPYLKPALCPSCTPMKSSMKRLKPLVRHLPR